MSVGGGDGKVEETAEERELARIGLDKVKRYQEVNKPIEDAWMARRKEQGRIRDEAARETTSQTRRAFGNAKEQVTASLSSAGMGGGRAAEAVSGLARDEATSMALGQAGAREAADDNYVAGLQGVVDLGRGQSASAINELSGVASAAGANARHDARLAQQARADDAAGLGMVAGLGAQQVIDRNYVPGKKSATDWASGYANNPYKTIPNG